MTRVLILAEVGVHREALAGSLGGDGRCDVVGVEAGLEEALTALEEVGPEIVLVDMPPPAGANAVRTLVAAAPEIKVVALGVPEVESDVIALAKAGALGYLAREGSIEDLVAVVEGVSRGEVLLSPDIAATLFRRATLARERQLEPIEEKLTARELEVLRLIEEGRSNKEIARSSRSSSRPSRTTFTASWRSSTPAIAPRPPRTPAGTACWAKATSKAEQGDRVPGASGCAPQSRRCD